MIFPMAYQSLLNGINPTIKYNHDFTIFIGIKKWLKN